jgi:hypothetical protein
MTTIKISQLTNSSVPLSGAEAGSKIALDAEVGTSGSEAITE